jgi:hypothetical protein
MQTFQTTRYSLFTVYSRYILCDLNNYEKPSAAPQHKLCSEVYKLLEHVKEYIILPIRVVARFSDNEYIKAYI